MNMINTGIMTNNALANRDSAAVKILQAKLNTVSKSENKTGNLKFVNGIKVSAPDNQNVNKKLMKVCKDFESIFVNQLFKVMRNTLNKKNNILHGGRGEEIFSDMLYQKYSRKVTEMGDFGFAKMVYEKLNSINRGY